MVIAAGRRGERRNPFMKIFFTKENKQPIRGAARASEARNFVLLRTNSIHCFHCHTLSLTGWLKMMRCLPVTAGHSAGKLTMVFVAKGTVTGRHRLLRALRPQKTLIPKGKIWPFQFRKNAQKGGKTRMPEEKRTKLSASTMVTVAELSQILGITSRRVRQLADEGVISSEGKNNYNLATSVQNYIKFLSKSLPDEDDTKLKQALRVAEAQLKASKAKIAKLEADELEGKMHRSEDVAEFTSDLIYTIRAALMALPGRLAVDAASCKTAAEAQVVIRTEVYRTMEEIAAYDYDPAKYEERVRERLSWEASGDSDDD
jgi:phage terminase Nu1 subunit (DNA packaging protein)